jgi:imidazolonepropionase-like amidohydrolase
MPRDIIMSRIVFTGSNVFDGNGPTVAGKTVVVDGDRIVEVCDDAALSLRADDVVIDAAGNTLMPGMVQAHWHGAYSGLNFEPPPVGLERPPGYLMLLAAKHAGMALERGFTSVIGAATGDALDAQLKQAIADGILEGPRIMACGRWLITTGDSNDLPDFWWWGITAAGSQRICDGADEFRKGVRQEIKEGAEVIKLFSDSGHALLYGSEFVAMTDEELKAAVGAAHDRGKKVRAHVTTKPNILQCIDVGVDILDHVDGMDAECIDRMLATDTQVCPSLYLTRAILDTIKAQDEANGTQQINEPFFVTMQQDYAHMCEILPEANEAGVCLMVGDDWGTAMTPHGDYAKEMQLYVDECGIAPTDVLRWATRNGARGLDMAAELGVVAAGRLADLVLVDGDPSTDIGLLAEADNVVMVMKEGRLVKGELANG